MAGMSGFTVFQPTLGAALQWLPALGTRELDNMINAFLPGPASIQDKRAHISMDFFEYARQTGQTFRFYAISAAAFTPITVESPASSAALYDSGYGSSFNVSPVVPDLTSWTQSPAALAPSASFDRNKAKTRSASSPSSSKKANASSSRQQTTDFANHPGMRIMTKDGRDVTNSASRGCKTREQRDHAHLMRIIKACDSCRRKKIRCDPSHKKRSASQASSTASQLESRPAKKTKKAADPPPLALPAAAPDFTVAGILEGTEAVPSLPAFDVSLENFDELWSQFVEFEPEAPVLATNYNIPEDYDFFFDAQGHFTPSSGCSSASPSQVFTPSTPAPPGLSPSITSELLPEISPSAPTLPYLNPGGTHGTNYLDFNLYSPASDFTDEEPLLAKQDLPSMPRPLRPSQRLPETQSQGLSNYGLSPETTAILDTDGLVSWPTLEGGQQVVAAYLSTADRQCVDPQSPSSNPPLEAVGNLDACCLGQPSANRRLATNRPRQAAAPTMPAEQTLDLPEATPGWQSPVGAVGLVPDGSGSPQVVSRAGVPSSVDPSATAREAARCPSVWSSGHNKENRSARSTGEQSSPQLAASNPGSQLQETYGQRPADGGSSGTMALSPSMIHYHHERRSRALQPPRGVSWEPSHSHRVRRANGTAGRPATDTSSWSAVSSGYASLSNLYRNRDQALASTSLYGQYFSGTTLPQQAVHARPRLSIAADTTKPDVTDQVGERRQNADHVAAEGLLASLLTVVLATKFLPTLPMRHRVTGGYAKNASNMQLFSLALLFPIVAMGLVSYLLASAMHSSNAGGPTDLPSPLFIICVMFASLAKTSLRQSVTTAPANIVPRQATVIDSVKSKIQPGAKLANLRCAALERVAKGQARLGLPSFHRVLNW